MESLKPFIIIKTEKTLYGKYDETHQISFFNVSTIKKTLV